MTNPDNATFGPASDAPAPPREVCQHFMRIHNYTTPTGWEEGICGEPLPCRIHPAASPAQEATPPRRCPVGGNGRHCIRPFGHDGEHVASAEATPPREEEQHQGWTKNDQPQEPQTRGKDQ